MWLTVIKIEDHTSKTDYGFWKHKLVENALLELFTVDTYCSDIKFRIDKGYRF